MQYHNVPQVPHVEVKQMNDGEIKSALARKGYKVHPYRLDAIAKAASKIVTVLCTNATLISYEDAIMAIDAARAIITGGAADDEDNA